MTELALFLFGAGAGASLMFLVMWFAASRQPDTTVIQKALRRDLLTYGVAVLTYDPETGTLNAEPVVNIMEIGRQMENAKNDGGSNHE